MKIRRILATAVAAAVTTPVVFLSAAPAFADTKPTPASTQKTTPGDEDEDPDFAEYEKLLAAVTKAEEKVKALKAERDALVDDILAHNVSPAVKAEYDAAKKAVEAAEAAKTTADTALAAAKDALAKLEADPAATPEQKTAATEAVTAAESKVAEAVTAKVAADARLAKADTARDDELVDMTRKTELLKGRIKVAEQELAAAEKALEEFEEGGFGECEEEDTLKSLKVALSGPKTVTAGQSASFSLRVSNSSEQTLEDVQVAVNAMRLPEPGEVIDDETDFAKKVIPVEWSSADNLEWTSFTEKFDSIEVGKLVKGGHYDVKLRLTVPADAPAGEGTIFGFGSYEKFDGDCGGSEQFAQAEFDILAAKGDKPTAKPSSATESPEPSPSTTTPTPAPTATSTGNDDTTQQGGSSNTPVNDGALAATGANDTLPLGLAAAGAVALGAGALVFARRRKAGANA
ncbi:LPXTG cell wall anchor domain-containing protein [Streptomyces sp. WAC01280]|uniref:LPXTG cell wall anchor domain-containing protein n=1 Tax=Streptomyces sp. WAC01280 TaxID=2487424 RepID=UPI000F76A137|nr:LPXTG cell wall anchor domain-containing protein [Streptomyces sp. WAC01280]RSS54872.1 LPXTG cell wall anchor domain-containing protein [Streptomyces sp. WAC01280]